MFDAFETDSNLETDGVWIDYGSFRVKVAHAGKSNPEYAKYAEQKLKPLRRAMANGLMTDARSEAVMIDIYAKTIIKGWKVKVEDDYKEGIETRDGTIVPVTYENIVSTFLALPRLFNDIVQMSDSIDNFRKSDLEADSGN
jgi:hypothetical protein